MLKKSIYYNSTRRKNLFRSEVVNTDKKSYKRTDVSIKIIECLLLGSADTNISKSFYIENWTQSQLFLSFKTMKFTVFICLLGVAVAAASFGNVGIGLVSRIDPIVS